eukprot:g9962.t1
MASADRDALEALFRSTGGDSWEQKFNWATDAELSTWHGVKVDEDNRVVELALGSIVFGNNLQGPIPEVLGSLTNLTVLGLSNNKLTGPIPEALGSLTNLTELNLWRNQLTGPIPEALGSLTNLTWLTLSHNKVSGHLPEALGSLTNLEELDLSCNQLTGPIPEVLGSLTKLTCLRLSENQLTGTVPLGVWRLSSLMQLELMDNLLTHFTDPEGETAATGVVLDCMERLERHGAAFPALYGFSAAGNPWEFPPEAVVANGLESIRKYYHTWEQCDFSLVEVLALKVVFVGAYGAGKTSLARSITMGRGDRTPDVDENSRTTVGVDLHSHNLSNGTECKIYDVAGQITYYGLHQFFLTERAVYVIVWDATKFEGLRGNDLDEAIEDNILEWVSLLHMRTPLCTVMLVGSHCDLLDGTPEDNEQLLLAVEKRFLELHEEWKSLRDDQSSSMDGRITILPGVFPVGCKLASESASFTAGDGLRAVDEALSRQTSVASRVPPSWVVARQVLELVGNDGLSGDPSGVDGGRCRPWELRSVLHAKFNAFVEEGRRNASQGAGRHHPASCLSGLRGDGIRYSMDGAIEMRAFSGTVISHDIFVVLDVRWLAGVLKPILDHRGVTKNKKRRPVFANRDLTGTTLLTWAKELVGRGILREGFARFLWGLKEQVKESVDDSHEMKPAMFEEILDEIGVTIPLPDLTRPDDESTESTTSAAAETKSPGDGGDAPRRHVVDLLVIMRLPLEADTETRDHLSSARRAALTRGETIDGGNRSIKAVFEFDHAGAPHGLPERVMAMSHKIGAFSPRARWRLGGLLLLRHTCSSCVSSMILEYDKKNKTFSIEALGQTTLEIRAVQFVISAFFHVARDFPGASWTGWMECGMGHDGEKMYHLATPYDKQNHSPGSEIVPLTRSSGSDRGSKQENMCEMRGFDQRGDCTLDPDIFGTVLDVRQPFSFSDVTKAKFGASQGRNANHDPSTTSQKLSNITKTISEVKDGMEGMQRGLRKIHKDIQGIARGMQRSLALLKNLQGPNYPYPHLVAIKKIEVQGKRSLRNRVRGIFGTEMALQFLCPVDGSKVPCGVGGNGYRLRKTRDWVKKFSPALQVTAVTAKVALRAVAGVDVSGFSEGFLQEFKTGLAEELIDGTLDEDELLRVLSGDEEVGADMQQRTRTSYEAIKQFMTAEEAERHGLSEEQQRVIDLVLEGKSVFVSGAAGTGKSFVLKKLREALKEAGKEPSTFFTATTGKAAVGIGGCTIHRFAGIRLGQGRAEQLAATARLNHNARENWRKCEVLVIDEISMMSAELFDKLNIVGQRLRGNSLPFGGVQLVLCGDFFQLPPIGVKDGTADFCFNARCWNDAVPESIILQQVIRGHNAQEDRASGGGGQAASPAPFGGGGREGARGGGGGWGMSAPGGGGAPARSGVRGPSLETHTRIFSKKKPCEEFNMEQLGRIKGPSEVFRAIDNGASAAFKDCVADERLELKVGAKVLLLQNLDTSAGLVNGATGVVTEFVQESGHTLPKVEFEAVEGVNAGKSMSEVIRFAEFSINVGKRVVATRTQLPLRLGWALTVHKSQGMTMRNVVLSMRDMFDCGQAYVALSRTTTLEGLHLLDFERAVIMAHDSVTEFYAGLGVVRQVPTVTTRQDSLQEWERAETLEVAHRAGVDKVRGYAWSDVTLDESGRKWFIREVCSRKNLCYKCGCPSHMVPKCPGAGEGGSWMGGGSGEIAASAARVVDSSDEASPASSVSAETSRTPQPGEKPAENAFFKDLLDKALGESPGKKQRPPERRASSNSDRFAPLTPGMVVSAKARATHTSPITEDSAGRAAKQVAAPAPAARGRVGSGASTFASSSVPALINNATDTPRPSVAPVIHKTPSKGAGTSTIPTPPRAFVFGASIASATPTIPTTTTTIASASVAPTTASVFSATTPLFGATTATTTNAKGTFTTPYTTTPASPVTPPVFVFGSSRTNPTKPRASTSTAPPSRQQAAFGGYGTNTTRHSADVPPGPVTPPAFVFGASSAATTERSPNTSTALPSRQQAALGAYSTNTTSHSADVPPGPVTPPAFVFGASTAPTTKRSPNTSTVLPSRQQAALGAYSTNTTSQSTGLRPGPVTPPAFVFGASSAATTKRSPNTSTVPPSRQQAALGACSTNTTSHSTDLRPGPVTPPAFVFGASTAATTKRSPNTSTVPPSRQQAELGAYSTNTTSHSTGLPPGPVTPPAFVFGASTAPTTKRSPDTSAAPRSRPGLAFGVSSVPTARSTTNKPTAHTASPAFVFRAFSSTPTTPDNAKATATATATPPAFVFRASSATNSSCGVRSTTGDAEARKVAEPPPTEQELKGRDEDAGVEALTDSLRSLNIAKSEC